MKNQTKEALDTVTQAILNDLAQISLDLSQILKMPDFGYDLIIGTLPEIKQKLERLEMFVRYGQTL